jgi:hypothetical protein
VQWLRGQLTQATALTITLVFVTDQGEVMVYRGTDPSSASTWALIGIWIVGAPIGNRCLMKYGGDLLVLTLDGLDPACVCVAIIAVRSPSVRSE